MRDLRRAVGAVLGAAAWWLVSCREVPTPPEGIMALSEVFVPSPGVVVGDTLRDSTGMVAPLRVIAFNLNGDPVTPQPTPTFVVIDTGAHIVDGAFLVGDSLGSTIQVVGSVAGIQTNPAEVLVTLAPDTLVAAGPVAIARTYSLLSGDTVVNSPPLNVIVQNLEATTPVGVAAVIVYYNIDRAPAGNGSGPTVVLVNNNRLSNRDTTDSGQAALVARLRLNALSVFAQDTVVVSATSSYRGLTIGTVQFTIVYTKVDP